MLSIHNILIGLNQKVGSLFENNITYGIVRSMRRGDETLPYDPILDKYLGIDDIYSFQLYHKMLSLSTTIRANSGFGDARGDIQNTYQMAMIVVFDSRKIKMSIDEIILYIQGNFPDQLQVNPYKRVGINFVGAILNQETVYKQEYNTDSPLGENYNIFQLNYTMETVFSKNCFTKCPEVKCN